MSRKIVRQQYFSKHTSMKFSSHYLRHRRHDLNQITIHYFHGFVPLANKTFWSRIIVTPRIDADGELFVPPKIPGYNRTLAH